MLLLFCMEVSSCLNWKLLQAGIVPETKFGKIKYSACLRNRNSGEETGVCCQMLIARRFQRFDETALRV